MADVQYQAAQTNEDQPNDSTSISCYKDTPYERILAVRLRSWGTNHCILIAMVQLCVDEIFLGRKAVSCTETTVTELTSRTSGKCIMCIMSCYVQPYHSVCCSVGCANIACWLSHGGADFYSLASSSYISCWLGAQRGNIAGIASFSVGSQTYVTIMQGMHIWNILCQSSPKSNTLYLLEQFYCSVCRPLAVLNCDAQICYTTCRIELLVLTGNR